jgi:protein O-mannosyl-transferase
MKKNTKNVNVITKSGKVNKKAKTDNPGNRFNNFLNKYFNIISFILIALIGIIVYSNSFDCSFHFDDELNITENPVITNLYNFVNLNFWLHLGRQIAYLSFALNYHFNNLDVFGYHLINILIHIITGIITFLLVKLILNLNNSKNIKFNKYKDWIALFSALFFVVHPLQTQAVTYIVQRMASMAAMFYILSIYLYAIGRIEHTQKNNILKAIIFYFLALTSGIIGVMTKENAATFPFVMLLFEFFFIRNKKNKIFKKYIIFSVSGFALICILYLLLNTDIFTTSATSGMSISSIDYLINQFIVIVRYLQLTILPINQCADYGNIVFNFPFTSSILDIKVIGCFLLLVGIFTLAVYLYKKNKAMSFGLFWFFIALSVESSIIPIADPMFEHRMYLPMLGIALFLISSLYMISNKIKPINVFSFLFLIIVIMGVFSYSRNKVWKSEILLLSDVIKNAPYNARCYYNRGRLIYKLADKQGAIKDFSSAIELKPNFAEAYYNRGIARKDIGDFDGAEQDYNRAIEIKPKSADYYINRGVLKENLNDFEGALQDYSIAIQINPNYAIAYKNRGKIKIDRGDKEGSLQDLNRSIELKPDYAEGYNGLGYYFFIIKDFKKSISYYDKAIEIKPDNTEAIKNLELVKHALENEKNK